ncbi:hypothetical protein OOZ51_00450 [Arthrobacter sp. MI7-26]|uniref:hypothetical protein n=1 Tax=Arthrobacter sp. MI7-26 TaxID=2993653 RepID=UPI0022497D64|nr:hypothetical protein [Arthrobacter sp. MI7-26]MCX2746282.1 hypothetical protein [Arthrobacter sp. MI7-26]
MEDLGHIDLAWSKNTWQIRPRTLTHLPGSSAFALILGERSVGFEEHVDSEFALHVMRSPAMESNTFRDPAALLLEYDTEAELREMAEAIEATFVSCAAVSVARSLTPLRPGAISSGPNRLGSPIQMFTTSTGFTDIDFPRRDGLYRQLANGRFNYWIFEAGTWAVTSHDEGVCLINGMHRHDLLKFRPKDNDGEPVGTLYVDSGLPLPGPHRRALTLCSGLSALTGRTGVWTYRNVPFSVALQVAKSLHQQLQTT